MTAVKSDTVRRRLETSNRHRLLGEVLMSEGKALEAVAEFRKWDRLPDGPSNTCLMCLPGYLALAFDVANMPDSAIHYATLAVTIYDPNRISDNRDPYYLPYHHRRLGELYEARGDRAKAVEHYRKVIALWHNADPELQKTVADLRARVRRLSDIEQTSR
jgi:tetratricopeptide (TPR) repeat protein